MSDQYERRKYEWRKQEKSRYLPKATPELIEIPEFTFLTLKGEGNPNDPEFSERIEALYALAYGIKMQLKRRSPQPEHYQDYTVYPLEGIWDITDQAKARADAKLNKDDLKYTLMIRQPDFVDATLFTEILELVKQKKKLPLLDHIEFETVTEGLCVQMLHLGSFDSEPESFAQMQLSAAAQGCERVSKVHREIYLSDPRKVSPDKYRTVLRFQVRHSDA